MSNHIVSTQHGRGKLHNDPNCRTIKNTKTRPASTTEIEQLDPCKWCEETAESTDPYRPHSHYNTLREAGNE